MVREVYLLTKRFPADELYGLTTRCVERRFPFHLILPKVLRVARRRSSHGFLSISLGSLAEMETQLLIATNLKYLAA